MTMDQYLQTNNELIIAIHKSLTESTQEINRKIEGLRDDIRDVKLSLAKNDHTMQEESNNWRKHTEVIVKELGERHEHQISSMHKLMMDLCIRQQSQPVWAQPLAIPTAPIALPKEVQAEVPETKPQTQEVNATQLLSKKETASGISNNVKNELKKVVEPIGFMPPGGVSNQQTKAATTIKSTTKGWEAPAPTFPTVESENDEKTPIVAVTTPNPPSLAIMTASTTNVAAPVAAGTNSAKTPVTFSFKAPSTNLSQASTPVSNDTGGGSVATGQKGGSLFGGGTKMAGSATTFGALAAKAAETGKDFLNSGAGKPPQLQFGRTPFVNGSAKDFKLFQQSFPQSPINAGGVRASDKGKDDSTAADEGSDKEDHEEFVPDVHYEPVVPLPPEVDVCSGEEGEEVIFSARCKLYRFDKELKENKERGLGELKLLLNPNTKRYRCVMRREQVFKLCANFPIYADLKLKAREHLPVYTWACKDFCEDPVSGTDETFSARFKNMDIAKEFSEKMTEAIEKS